MKSNARLIQKMMITHVAVVLVRKVLCSTLLRRTPYSTYPVCCNPGG